MNTITETVTCQECHRAFKNLWGLRVHYNKSHKGINPPDEVLNSPRVFKKREKKINLTINNKEISQEKFDILPKNFNCCPNCGFNFRALFSVFNVANKINRE